MAKQDGLQATTEQGGMRGSGVAVEPLKKPLARSDAVIVDHNTKSPIVAEKDGRRHPDPAIAQTIANMVFAGMTQETICKVLKMGMDTLYKHYKHELDTGQAAIVNDIAQSLAQRAKAGSDTAAIFLLKTRGSGKFTERNAVELTGKDGNPIEITHRAEVVSRLAGTLAHGITLDGEAEPID